MMMSDDGMPAASIAFFRSGASKSAHRSELVVSGRIAAILPVPFAAIDFSCVIALKLLLLSCVSEIPAVAWAVARVCDVEATALAPLPIAALAATTAVAAPMTLRLRKF